MIEENFFDQIKEEQEKQQDKLSALQKILDAAQKQEQTYAEKPPLTKRIKKMFDKFCQNRHNLSKVLND